MASCEARRVPKSVSADAIARDFLRATRGISMSSAVASSMSPVCTASWPASRRCLATAGDRLWSIRTSRGLAERQLAFAHGFSRVAQRFGYVLWNEIWELGDDLAGGHAVCHHHHDGRYGDPEPTDARLAVHLASLDGDPTERHVRESTPRLRRPGQRSSDPSPWVIEPVERSSPGHEQSPKLRSLVVAGGPSRSVETICDPIEERGRPAARDAPGVAWLAKASVRAEMTPLFGLAGNRMLDELQQHVGVRG